MPAKALRISNLLSLLMVLCFLIVTQVTYAQSCNSNDPGAPCFAGNKDILNGQRTLLQDDDLVFSGDLANGSDPSGFSAANSLFTTSKSQFNPSFIYTSSGGPIVSNTIANTAKFFNSNPAGAVSAFTASTSSQSQVTLTYSQVSGGNVSSTQSLTMLPSVGAQYNSNQNMYSVAADFAGTGSDQLVIAATQLGAQFLSFQVAAANDPSTPSSGLKTGLISRYPYRTSLCALAAGTFTDPPSSGPAPRPLVALLCSNDGLGLHLGIYSVDPATLRVDGAGGNGISSLNLGNDTNAQMATISIAAGRFGGAQHDQLVIAYAPYGGETAKIVTVDFNSAGQAVQQTTPYDTGIAFYSKVDRSFGYPGSVILRKGRFNFFGDSDQAALSLVPGQNSVIFEVLSFDQQLNITENPRYTPPNPCHYDMAVGRFDRYSRSSPSNITPYPEIVDASTQCSGSNQVTLSIYDVDPGSFAIDLRNSYVAPRSAILSGPYYGSFPPLDNAYQVSLAAGDLQGRSLLLGDPEKAVVTGHIQPDTILGLPPMHVDWITPAATTTPSILNVTVYPKTYNSGYNFQSSSKSSASRSQTTSYTASTKETAGEKVSYGVPGIGSVSVSAQQAFTQTHQNSVAKKYNTYQGTQTNLNTATTFDDELTATVNQMNIYSYRVLGHCVSSSGAPGQEGCAPGYAPMYVQFSGPDNVQYLQFAEGRNLEWYQPVQEPGNIFSYPGSLQQLKANLPPSTPLVPYTTPKVFDVQGQGTEFLKWSAGKGNSVTTGSVSGHSFDASVSVSGKVSLGFFSSSATAGFSYNQSKSVSRLNQSTSSLDSSQGVAINLGLESPGTEQVYDYSMVPVIYGQQPPSGTLQADIVQTAQVKATGVLDVGWIADPLGAGNFWRQAYGGFPDVALNHPQRWIQKTPGGTHGEQVQFLCPIGYTNSLSAPACVAQTPPVVPNPSNVADDGFYQIKGLFVTPGQSTNGPQITNATVGDTVTLRVRVYNYSVQSASMLPPGTKVRVQFYAQPWNGILGQFANQPNNSNAFANAAFIGEDLLAPIPGFCGGVTDPTDPCTGSGQTVSNWVFAQTTWNTSSLQSNSYWKFWAVTWLENNGQMLPELAGHGLPPSTLKACLGKPNTPCFQNIGDVAVASARSMDFETYSNNFGYYNQVFSVFPLTSTGESISGTLSLDKVKSSQGDVLLRDKPARIEAHHHATGHHYDSILAVYYDGDPDKGGTQYDVEYIPRINADSDYVDPGNYEPKSCGVHHLYVRAIPLDGSAPAVTASTVTRVTIDPVQSIDETLVYLGGLNIDPALRNELEWKLKEARKAFQQSKTAEGRCKIDEFLEILRHHANRICPDAIKAVTAQEKDLLDCTE